MNGRILALMGLALLGCGGGDDDDESGFTCEPADRTGSYWVEFETLSGNCGPQDSALVHLDEPTAEPGGGCVELSEPDISADGCRVDVHRECPLDSLIPGASAELTTSLTQRDAAGDTLTGTMTMYIRDSAGELCHGSYRMTYTRQ